MPLWGRLVLVFVCVAFVAIAVYFMPLIAKRIAYAWNIGAERAKVEVAKKFLNDNPLSEQRIPWVAQSVAPSVVGIQSISASLPLPSLPDRNGYSIDRRDIIGTDFGSGIIVDAKEGYILTNYHVIENAYIISVRLSDGRVFDADIIGGDRYVDFAVLRIEPEDLEAIDWGDSRQVVVGEQVIAIGSPYGLQQTVTSGIISATERYPVLPTHIPAHNIGQQTRFIPYLQTDAAINPDNSGGALVDINGKLIGICTAIISAEHGGNSGIGFAIPSFTAKRIYDDLVMHGTVRHGWIGVELEKVTSFEARQMEQKKPMGAVVRNLRRRSPARDAGIQRNDIILRWGETEISDPLHLIHLVTFTNPGTKETVEVFRKGELLMLEITVGTRPTDL